ncbi:exosortase O [Iningainema tapete]|uniref:Exosortase O n=1 Tax=Iningainema tapete BLCC-T55 TaxID=2748662 RepID=A0A8J6XJ15_9CYAN|nr:exosortase O [Iningainema tapete]MBD2772369.1 exosortase O [Iningainema tapete BLCC-T55]
MLRDSWLKNSFRQEFFSVFVLLIAWIFVHISSIQWLLQSFRQASSFNLVAIALAISFLLVQTIRYRHHLQITPLTLQPYPLLLMLGVAVSAIASRWLLDIKQIEVILFALSTYGLCGLFFSPILWRKGLPVAIAIACFLPFSAQFETGLGFPVRILTAHIVEQLLTPFQVTAISSQDIIVLENGIAHVDIPCSGLKSLWTGMLFLLAATWLERRQLGIRWWLVCCANLFSLVSANMLRVLLLVVITQIWHQPTIAQVLHVPLGLIGWVVSCALTWKLLQTVPRYQDGFTKKGRGQRAEGRREEILIKVESQPAFPGIRKSARATLLTTVIALALIGQLHPKQIELTIASLNLPKQIISEQLPLTAVEQSFFQKKPNTIAQKQRFVSGQLTGSMLLVGSTSWQAFHPPELCFVGSGMKVDTMERKQLTPDIMARWLSLQNGKLSATYWFQSPQSTTDDFLARIWEYVIHRQKPWLMISILFDRTSSPEDSEIQAFVTNIHKTIAHTLNPNKL